MEVWSETPPQPEPATAAAAQDKGPVWAPLERYVKGEVAPLPLTSPVYTGISLHYRWGLVGRSELEVESRK